MTQPITITEAAIVLVEGVDECNFLPQLQISRALPLFQCIDYGGKDQLGAFLRTLHTIPGYHLVKGLAVIRDADTNSADALSSVRESLRRANLPVPNAELAVATGPPLTAIFITPGNGQNGEIEDCCLASVSAEPRTQCIDTFVTCVEGTTATRLRKQSKAKLQAFIASYPEKPLHYFSQGARVGMFPLNHAAFDGFETLIRLVA